MAWFNRKSQIETQVPSMAGTLNVIAIEHDLSQRGDASQFASWLYTNMMSTSQALQDHRLGIEFVWEGYEHDPRELWDIPEVVAFNRDLNQRWPCSLYFLGADSSSLLVMVFSLLGAELSGEPVAGRGVSRVDRQALSDLFSTSWEPRLRQIAEMAQLPSHVADEMLQTAWNRFRL